MRRLGRSLQLFRLLIPSWRFFDSAGPVPVLSYRTGGGDPDGAEWKEAIEPPPRERSWAQLVFNPTENLRLAEHSLVRQLVSDLNDWPDEALETFPASVSFALVDRLVVERLRREGAEPPLLYRFRVTLEGEELLVSGERELP